MMRDEAGRFLIDREYYNCNDYATAIVAVVTDGIDWTAYIGGAPVYINRQDAVRFVARTGAKLSREDAEHYFPDLSKELPFRP